MSRLGLTAKVDNQKQVVTVNPVNNINVNVRSPAEIQNESDKTVIYPDDSGIYVQATQENINKLTSDLAQQMSNNEALKIIISMFKDNPIFVNALLLTDDEKLAQLVKLLTNADEVNIDAENIGEMGCCTPRMYRKVNAIYVITNGNTKNLKYDYPDIMKQLKDLGINTKIVW